MLPSMARACSVMKRQGPNEIRTMLLLMAQACSVTKKQETITIQDMPPSMGRMASPMQGPTWHQSLDPPWQAIILSATRKGGEGAVQHMPRVPLTQYPSWVVHQ